MDKGREVGHYDINILLKSLITHENFAISSAQSRGSVLIIDTLSHYAK